MKIKIWALSYASIYSDDELYTATIGLYNNEDDAFKAMKDYVSYDIKDGDIEDNWKINGNTADYVDDFSITRKSYRINSL